MKSNAMRWLAFLCLAPLGVHAQLSVSLKLRQERVLPGEPVPATITIRNNTGQLMTFGGNAPNTLLRLVVERSEGRALTPETNPVLLDGVQVMPGETKSAPLNLGRLYYFRDTGLYRIQASVQWDSQAFASPAAYLDVMRGVEIERLRIGLPGQAGAERTYRLHGLTRPDGEMLYLSIEDERGRIHYGVLPLGRFIRFSPPTLRTDEAGNVHVLFHARGMNHVHTAFTPGGVQLFAEAYLSPDGSIRLVQLPTGKVVVEGMAETPDTEFKPETLEHEKSRGAAPEN